MLQVIPNKELSSFVKALGSDWYLYNIDVIKDAKITIVKIASNDTLSGTIQLKYNPMNDEVTFNTVILTDTEMYSKCMELIDQFKNTKNKFMPSSNFYNNFGGDGMISVKIIINDENINSIFSVMELIEFERKIVVP